MISGAPISGAPISGKLQDGSVLRLVGMDAHLIVRGSVVSSMDGLLQNAGVSQASSMDAAFLMGKEAGVDLDAVVSALGNLSGAELDAALQNIKATRGVLVDAVLQAYQQKLTSMDAHLFDFERIETLLDALLKGSAITGVSLDAALLAHGIKKSAVMDGALQIIQAAGIDIDASLQKAGSTGNAAVDAVLATARAESAGMDARLVSAFFSEVGLDGAIMAAAAIAATLDAHLVYFKTVSVVLDGIFVMQGRVSAGMSAGLVPQIPLFFVVVVRYGVALPVMTSQNIVPPVQAPAAISAIAYPDKLKNVTYNPN